MTEYEGILSKAEVTRLGKLVVLLNIAEQLDRVERSTVKDVSIKILKNRVTIKLVSDESVELERASATRYADRFAKQFGISLTFH